MSNSVFDGIDNMTEEELRQAMWRLKRFLSSDVFLNALAKHLKQSQEYKDFLDTLIDDKESDNIWNTTGTFDLPVDREPK